MTIRGSVMAFDMLRPVLAYCVGKLICAYADGVHAAQRRQQHATFAGIFTLRTWNSAGNPYQANQSVNANVLKLGGREMNGLIYGFPFDGVITVNRVILKEGYTIDDLQERVAELSEW